MMTRAVGTLTPGTLLYQGRYRIDLLLATTPHRAIYRAWNLARGRASTIIELAPATDQLATRALALAAPLVQLDHPALTGFQVVFVEQETVFIGMAFAGGQLLDRIMDERLAPIQPAAAVRWISQAAEMLEFFAGSLPLWHLGDLSPSALFVTVEDRTQILGFEVPLGLLTPAEIAAGLPPGSVAPELSTGQCDARSDVYSLAASLYLLLTRQRWAGGDPTTETTLTAVAPTLPPTLIDAVRRGLARDPAGRWQDAAAFNSALLGAMAAPAEATNGNWWESMPSEPESDTQEMQRVDLTAAAAAGAAAAADASSTMGISDPALADPSTTLDRVPSHIFTDAADDLDPTTKQPAISLPQPADDTPTNDATSEAVPEAVPETTPIAASPSIHPALLDSLAADSGELNPHGLEDMQPIDHSVIVEPESSSDSVTTSPPLTAPIGEAMVDAPTTPTPETPANTSPYPAWQWDAPPVPQSPPTREWGASSALPYIPAESTTHDAPTDVPTDTVVPPTLAESSPFTSEAVTTHDAPEATMTTSTPTNEVDAAPVTDVPHESNIWGWAAAGVAGIAGAGVAAAALHHEDAPTEVLPDPNDTVDAATVPPLAAIPDPPPPQTGTYVPSWATTPEDTLAPETTPAPTYIPWGYTDALSMAPGAPADSSNGYTAPTEVDPMPTVPDAVVPPTPAPFRYSWQLDDEEPLGTAPADAPATETTPVAADEPPPAASPAMTDAELDADQLGAWTRFADRVSPSTIAQATSAFAGWSASPSAIETDPLPPVAPPAEMPASGADADSPEAAPDATTAIVPPTHPMPSPFVGQSISAHADRRYDPNMPPPSARSKTPSRPLGNNPLFNRIRDLLGATSEPSAALGTIVLPRHMYPQHSYSILVRLQTRTPLDVGGDKRMAIVEIQAPANAFYLPVRRLALPIPAEGGLSEGTLSITALRPSTGASDRIIFTFKQTDGVVLHKGAYVADVSILTAQQITNGEPMITLVHPLDIPA